jgi:phenylacetate 2-hydroxylase
MVAAGLDTLPSNINMAIAYLSSAHGQEIQQRAFNELQKAYPDGSGWRECLQAEHCEYVMALVKENLRYWSTFNLSIPRVGIKKIEYKGVTFPADTPFVMVSRIRAS